MKTIKPIHLILIFAASCSAPVVPSQTATALPTHTPTATQTLTPSPTFTHAPTLTPLPTLARDKAEALIEELLSTNAGCRLPCWWGITPGKTKWEEAERFLKNIAVSIKPDYGYYSVTFFLPKQFKSYGPIDKKVTDKYAVDISSGIITSIHAYTLNLTSFSLSQVLEDYGEPFEIFIYTISRRREGELPFRIALFYPDQGITIIYYYEGKEKGGNRIESCLKNPEQTSSSIFLWTPKSPRNDIGLGLLDFDRLKDIADITVSEFYEIYKNPTYTKCLEVIPR